MSAPGTYHPASLAKLGIELDESLEQLTEAIQAELRETLRSALRIAMRVALAKRAHFKGDFGPWLAWVTGEFGVAKRQAITWCNAGEVLMQHLVRHDALSRCDLTKLEIIGALNSQQVGHLLAQHPDPGALERDELREIVNRLLGRTSAAAAPRQLALPGLELLVAFDAARLDPYQEAQYLTAFVARTSAALGDHAAALSDEQAEEIDQLIAGTEAALAAMKQTLAARQAAAPLALPQTATA